MSILNKTVSNLSPMKRIMIGAAVLLTIALTIAVAQMSGRSNMVLLYAGLESKAAGEVIARLEQDNVPSEIRGNAIYVNEADRDRVRMSLAASGLPAGGQDGYELLDGLSGFGTTSEMFDAAYWRAKEGELARTLLSTPGIAQARVHIGAPRRESFARTRAIPTASITLTGTSGGVSRSSATAARYMVALAIPGLAAEQVAVIDARNGVLLRPGEDGPGSLAMAQNDQAEKMRAQVQSLLAARVGAGNAQVSVNIETYRESESVTRRVIDPESKTLRESRTVEMSEQGQDTGGAVTVASNLPDGDGENSAERNSQREEARNTEVFDYTETRSEVLRPGGAMKRVTVAVLVNDIRSTAEDGTVSTEARSPEEMEKLEALVKSAVGFDEERGDLVTVESISFAEIPQEGSLATAADKPSFAEMHMMELIQMGIVALVALILGLFVVRPVLASAQAQPNALEDDDPALSAIDVTPPQSAEAAAAAASANLGAQGNPSALGEPAPAAPPTALELLRDTVSNRSEESAAVLKQWLEPPETPALEQAR